LKGAIWEDESWDRIIRHEDELLDKARYMLENPEKRWLGLRDYKWVYLNLPAASESYTATEGCATAFPATTSQAPTEGVKEKNDGPPPLKGGGDADEGPSGIDTGHKLPASQAEEVQRELQPRLVDLIVELQLAPSKSEARRLIAQGGVKLDGETITDHFAPYIHVAPTLLQVGKRKIVRLI
jgi:hypothetical protein